MAGNSWPSFKTRSLRNSPCARVISNMIALQLMMVVISAKASSDIVHIVEEQDNVTIVFQHQFTPTNALFCCRIYMLHSLTQIYEYDHPQGILRSMHKGRLTVYPEINEDTLMINVTIRKIKQRHTGTYRFYVSPIINGVPGPPEIEDHSIRVTPRLNCIIGHANYDIYLREIYCNTSIAHDHHDHGRTISCYRAPGAKAPFREDVKHYPNYIDVTYWLTVDYPLRCCAHALNKLPDYENCQHFIYIPSAIPPALHHDFLYTSIGNTVGNEFEMEFITGGNNDGNDVTAKSKCVRIGFRYSLIYSVVYLCTSLFWKFTFTGAY